MSTPLPVKLDFLDPEANDYPVDERLEPVAHLLAREGRAEAVVPARES